MKTYKVLLSLGVLDSGVQAVAKGMIATPEGNYEVPIVISDATREQVLDHVNKFFDEIEKQDTNAHL